MSVCTRCRFAASSGTDSGGVVEFGLNVLINGDESLAESSSGIDERGVPGCSQRERST